MPKQRHNYFMMSVFEFTTVRTEHGSRAWQVPVNLRDLSPRISRWTLVLTRLKYRQMKCPSSHQQSIHSPPSPQGRIYSVIIHTGRSKVTSSACIKHPPGILLGGLKWVTLLKQPRQGQGCRCQQLETM